MKLTTELLLIVAAVLAVAVAVVLALRTPPPAAAIRAQAPATCDLQTRPCRATFADGLEVELAIEPRPIPLLTPLHLQVTLSQPVTADHLVLDLLGIGMNMGLNRFSLTTVDHILYQGQGQLPICTWQRMPWEARLLIPDHNGERVAVFYFETQR